jgi:hypothetical protein
MSTTADPGDDVTWVVGLTAAVRSRPVRFNAPLPH